MTRFGSGSGKALFSEPFGDTGVGVFAPAKTPKPIIDRLAKELAIVLADPETDAKIRSIGAAPMIGGPKELAALLDAEIARAGKVVKDAGIQPE